MSYNWTSNIWTPVAVDGQFGPQTVRALQYGLGAAVDGSFGPATVTALQQFLNVPADGLFGPQTVKALQARLGVAQDGAFGPATATALQQALNAGTLGGASAPNPVPVTTSPPSTGNAAASAAVLTAWIQEAFTVLEAHGTGAALLSVSDVLLIIAHESSGIPDAENNWDSNAQAGDPSRGLMQTIGATFDTWALPGYSSDIFDPVSNIIAACRYAVAAYGSIQNVPGVVAVEHGGNYVGY